MQAVNRLEKQQEIIIENKEKKSKIEKLMSKCGQKEVKIKKLIKKYED